MTGHIFVDLCARWIQQTPVIQLSASANVEDCLAFVHWALTQLIHASVPISPPVHQSISLIFISFSHLPPLRSSLAPGHTDSPIGRILCVRLCWSDWWFRIKSFIHDKSNVNHSSFPNCFPDLQSTAPDNFVEMRLALVREMTSCADVLGSSKACL